MTCAIRRVRFRGGGRYCKWASEGVREISGVLGLGLPFAENAGLFDMGVEFVRRGHLDDVGVREDAVRFLFGITGSRKWFEPRKD